MQKIILDTNVIVSALISNSIPTQILYNLVLTKSVINCLSYDIYEEYIDVLNRDKFKKYKDFKTNADIVLTKIREISTFYDTIERIEILKDHSDNKFLELAVASSADYLITGNVLDFNFDLFNNTHIVTPREYWDTLVHHNRN